MTVPAFVDVALHVTLVLAPREWRRWGWNAGLDGAAAGFAVMLGVVRIGITFGAGD